jgi:hypothetical protein
LFGREWRNGFDVSSLFSLAVGLASSEKVRCGGRERVQERAGWLAIRERRL